MPHKHNIHSVRINRVPTTVITWGKQLDEIDEQDTIILCVPGNPGVTQFYTTFLEKIHRQSACPVWIVGHAGHEPPLAAQDEDANNSLPSLNSNHDLYNLAGQVEHKRAFIQQYIPNGAKIHFIGHSIGCYMVLELLKDAQIREQTVSKYLLFPTIERMAESPNGRLLTKFVYHINSFILWMAWIFTIFPRLVKTLLVKCYTTYFRVSDQHFDTIVDFIEPNRLEKVFFLAYDEMDKVTVRDDCTLRENRVGMKLYYGASDRWCPQTYCRDLLEDIEGIDAQICTRGFEHAFVLRFSEQVANMVAEWI